MSNNQAARLYARALSDARHAAFGFITAEDDLMPRPLTSPVRTITATLDYDEVAALVLLLKRKAREGWSGDAEAMAFPQDREGMAAMLESAGTKLLGELEAALARPV